MSAADRKSLKDQRNAAEAQAVTALEGLGFVKSNAVGLSGYKHPASGLFVAFYK